MTAVGAMTPQRGSAWDTSRFDQTPSTDAGWLDRALLLRLLGRDEEALRALGALSPGARDSVDARLTAAYLRARSGDFAGAVVLARPALGSLPSWESSSAVLSVTLARWSMARGPEGIADAIAMLDARSRVSSLAAPELATLVLALVRAGREAEATALARTFGTSLAPWSGDVDAAEEGNLTPGEGPASIGMALLLGGRAREAVEPLRRAVGSTYAVWATSNAAWLRRAEGGAR